MQMRRRQFLSALGFATVVVLAPTAAFPCLGAYESWVLARVDEVLAAGKLPVAELTEGGKLRERAARLMTEHRYGEARQVLESAVRILHIEFKDDDADSGVPTLTAEPGCGAPPKS
jgi:hypothetical protein